MDKCHYCGQVGQRLYEATIINKNTVEKHLICYDCYEFGHLSAVASQRLAELTEELERRAAHLNRLIKRNA